jgi:hypothetical protein
MIMTIAERDARGSSGEIGRKSRKTVGRALRIAAVVVVVLIAAGAYVVTRAPAGPRTLKQFEPARLADLELRMWQAYYAKENVRLFALLVTMMREQYHYSWATATREAFHLARAAATFGNARSNYEEVLPDLEAGYTIARDWLDARFDPRAVARAELAWWVARRIPGQNSPEHVGDLIADSYALLYETSADPVRRSGRLRAQAAALRDAQASAPDWGTIGQLLNDSYVDLKGALE